MTTTAPAPEVTEATPNTDTIIYVIGNDIQSVIDGLDFEFGRLHAVDRQGEYVKFDKVFDILLDIRGQLKDLVTPPE